MQMKRAAPNPAVILLPGDFLMHDFVKQIGLSAASPQEAGIRTMRRRRHGCLPIASTARGAKSVSMHLH
jgi:hypothetical protein